MREAFWNGLFDVRWEEAPLGPEAIRLIQRLRERGYAGRTCRDYGHAVVHLGRYLHEELESDRVRDEGVVADFLAGHLPGCRCYRRPMGRREEPARRGLAHLLVMLRGEGAFPPVTADEPPYRQLSALSAGTRPSLRNRGPQRANRRGHLGSLPGSWVAGRSRSRWWATPTRSTRPPSTTRPPTVSRSPAMITVSSTGSPALHARACPQSATPAG